jgi:hypothetical protein
MKVWSIVLFFVCLQLACVAVTALSSQGVLPFGTQVFKEKYSIGMIESEFALAGILGAGVGFGVSLVGFLLKQYTFGFLAGAIWVLGILSGICTWVLVGLRGTMDLFLAGTGLEWISYIIYAGVLVMFFGLMLEQLGNKPLT